MNRVRVEEPGPVPFEAIPAVWRECLQLAWEAHQAGSLPIGAVVVDADGNLIGRGRNRISESHVHSPHLTGTPYLTGTPLAHAELNALLEMGDRPPGPRPTVYTTLEPCPLCMGASRMAGVGNVIFASRDAWAGCSMMAEDVPYIRRSGPTAEGPIEGLEAPLIAWQTSVHARSARNSPFFEGWEKYAPTAFRIGLELLDRGELDRLASQGAEVAVVWKVLQERLAGA